MRHSRLALPDPADRRLVFFVREAFPSHATGTAVQEGLLADGWSLQVAREMDDGGVVFGDGIEADKLEFQYGARLRVACAKRSLRLVRAQ